MKADATRQWRLLDLVDLDTRIAQLRHRRRTSAEQTAVEQATRELAVVRDEAVRARTAHGDVEREVRRAEEAVEQVRERKARNQARLDSGQGTAKDLQALSHEIDSLTRRQGVLEDEQMEIMERAEALQATADEVTGREEAVAARLAEAQQALDSVHAEVDRELEEVARSRADVAAGVGADLLGLYDKVGEQVGGIGAAALVARRCTGCNLELGPVDLSRIRAAADDDVVRCEECRRILVRTGESGL